MRHFHARGSVDERQIDRVHVQLLQVLLECSDGTIETVPLEDGTAGVHAVATILDFCREEHLLLQSRRNSPLNALRHAHLIAVVIRAVDPPATPE